MIAMLKYKSKLHDALDLKASALRKLHSGNYVRAKEEYKLALIMAPGIISEVILDYERILEIHNGNIGLRLSLADLYLRVGDFDSSMLELEEILDIAPKTEPVYDVLGRILMASGKVDSTIKLLERAIKFGLKSTTLTEMLAGAYLESGNINKSISLYEDILGLSPKNKNTLRVLGDLYFRVRNFEKSATMFTKLYEIDSSTYEEVVRKLEDLIKNRKDGLKIREMLAEIYLKGRDPDKAVEKFKQIFTLERFRAGEAIAKYKKALDVFPGHTGLINALADALILRGAYTEAAAEYSRLVKLGPEYYDLAIQGYIKISKRFPGNVLAHRFLGEAYEKQEKFHEAINEYRIVISLDPKEADHIARRCREIIKIRPDIASVHLVLGEVALIKKDFKKVISEAEEILSVDGENIDGYILLGEGNLGLKRNSKASEAFRLALNHDPHDISIQQKLESSRKCELEDSIKALKARIREDQWRKSLHLDLAKLYLELKNWDEATKELQEALRDQSREPFAYNLLGLSLKEQGKFELAVSQFKKALEILPNELSDLDKAIRSNLALTYEALGNIDDAVSSYETIREKDISYGNTEKKIQYLRNANPNSFKNKMYALVLRDFGCNELVHIWGSDGRRVLHSRKTGDFGMSFAQTHNDKGCEHLQKGRYRSAEDEFLLASSMDSKMPSALNNLAVVYAHNGRFDDAKTKLSAALQEDPKHAVLHNNLGVVLYLKGDVKAAEVEFLRAVSIDPELSATIINIGDSYYSQGNSRQAIAYWEKVKEFSVVSELASRRLRYKIPNYQ